MGGKGELVAYTREYSKKLSDIEKKNLKEKITRMIDASTKEITIIVLEQK